MGVTWPRSNRTSMTADALELMSIQKIMPEAPSGLSKSAGRHVAWTADGYWASRPNSY